jgi:hypothetical protein
MEERNKEIKVDEEKQMLGSIKEQPFLNAGSEVFTAL